jgi:hypothetical protein
VHFKGSSLLHILGIGGNRKVVLPPIANEYIDRIRAAVPAFRDADAIVANALRRAARSQIVLTEGAADQNNAPVEGEDPTYPPLVIELSEESELWLLQLREEFGRAPNDDTDDAALILWALMQIAFSPASSATDDVPHQDPFAFSPEYELLHNFKDFKDDEII